MPIATLWPTTLRAVQHWWKDNCLRLAASLAYYTALSLAPLLLLIVGVVGLVPVGICGTAVFGELQATMNLIWEVQPAPTSGVWAGIWAWLRERIFSLAIVFALAFLLLVSLVISAALAGAAALFQGPEEALLSRLLDLAVSLLVLTFMFALLYNPTTPFILDLTVT